MTHPDLSARIRANLKQAGLSLIDLRVQRSPAESWRIAVVSEDFAGRSREERKQATLGGLESVPLDWLDLLTPEEQEWAGALPIDTDGQNLPLWPEALARAEHLEAAVAFPSDLDEDLPKPIVTTFYSLRGGVGRSTALAYTARLLASRGRSVICVDLDLEAPGLAALFGREEEIRPEQGLLHALLQLEQGETPDLTKHLLRASDTDELYCFPAGTPSAEYARLLSLIDPAAWYREERNPLRELIAYLETRLPFTPDVILLDARTGISQLSAPLLFDLADIAVIVFFPHPQAAVGTASLVRALLSARTRRNDFSFTPEPRFLVSPVPASKAPEVTARYRGRALEWIADWLQPARRGREASLIESELTHFVLYRETIATSDKVLDDREVWRDYEPVADWLERFLPTSTEARETLSLAGKKAEILSQLRFSTGAAEQVEDLAASFVETDSVRRALLSSLPLVLGRKGTGKTAVFRRLFEDPSIRKMVVVAPPGRLRSFPWLLRADGFREAEEVLRRTASDWRQFWLTYICVAVHYQWSSSSPGRPAPEVKLRTCLGEGLNTELEAVRVVDGLLGIEQAGLLLSDWLSRLDESAEETLLLVDGLDTGFGNSAPDRERRQRAIEGLFAFLTDRGDELKRLRLKIMLREDIWKGLQFENKSHLFGRSVKLVWNDKTDFLRVVVKQAMASEVFHETLSSSLGGKADFADWADGDVLRAWSVLVGERMKGGKTTFTRNWVWNRLADGNEDHSPRYLLQLFNQVVEWEKRVQAQNPYERSIVRPRGLIEVLPSVSEQALQALRAEEFPELNPLLEKLTSLGRTPVDAGELEDLRDLVDLAREVGLLGIYEGSGEIVQRYRVPEIYRYGLSMTRKGQA